jgi:hypothetical protein
MKADSRVKRRALKGGRRLAEADQAPVRLWRIRAPLHRIRRQTRPEVAFHLERIIPRSGACGDFLARRRDGRTCYSQLCGVLSQVAGLITRHRFVGGRPQRPRIFTDDSAA